ncbi:hypothetical protein C463_01376 [Halorubrum californiense DSM 19288]|uniref:Uncharacterized protein n=1 Tax=Halorubrum californiense DSM 19288 TaxID=1227465 RepID=M0EP64_9EURY|nr:MULTISPECIES: hypothetical protein [Halorubrum]ELZ48199.1 hypothetical protein C463_01376 [Halorubrum californiense DSM 19288]TKX72528.1 hypothetical protein EXE40_03280 [Halorubrum sp. GN11GM_10-3_MGM]
MPGPLGDATRRDLTDAAAERLAAAGFAVDRPETGAEPPAIATRGDDRVAVEPLAADDATPTVIVSRLGHALDRDRRVLFVARDDATAAAVRDLLADPPLLADRTDGRRTFHVGPDRIPVSGGGYACVRSDGLGDPTFSWRETDTPLGPVTAHSDVDAAAVDDEGRPVVPRLVCEVDGAPVAVLAGVDSLHTPPDAAFPFAYRRDPDDKRFRVRRGDDGTVVETVGGFAALREAGSVPIPMPLVPEHALGRSVDDDALAAAWDLSVIVEEER